MGTIQTSLQGIKCYLVCSAAILAAIIGYASETLTLVQMIAAILTALAGITASAKINRLIDAVKK